jgi:penicillin-binding protein 2
MSEKRSLFGPEIQEDPLSSSERSFVDEKTYEPQLLPSEHAHKRERFRRRLGVICCAGVFFFMGVRLAELQVIEGEELRLVADQNRLQSIVNVAHRGRLYDRNNIVLAQNDPDYRFLGYTSVLPESDEQLQEAFAALIVACSLTSADLLESVHEARQHNEQEFVLADQLSTPCALTYLANGGLPDGIRIEVNEERSYITDKITTLSHILGYTGGLSAKEYEEHKNEGYRVFDVIGKQGVEQLFEERLKGENGETLIEVDAQGGELRTLLQEDPVQGEDLTLSLDANLHAAIEQILADHLKDGPVQRASVVVMHPNTGEVMAMVSYPSFDANLFVQGIDQETYSALVNDPNAPLFNRSIAGSYPAGSTIKILYAAGALTDGIITPQTTFFSTGGVWLGNRFFPDWRAGGHGLTNVYHAIADSVNTFFYAVGGGMGDFHGMGIDRLMEWARMFGLGEYTGIGLSGESRGFLPSKTWKEETKGEPWYVGDTYNVSIGQGDVLVSPLQIARVTSTIANGGNLVTPTLLKGEQGDMQTIITPDVVQIVREGMRDTVLNGTARAFQSLPVEAAGKTGTAQWSSIHAAHSWFTGFAPFDNPEMVVTVIVEQGGDLAIASPVARDVMQWYFTNNDNVGALNEETLQE